MRDRRPDRLNFERAAIGGSLHRIVRRLDRGDTTQTSTRPVSEDARGNHPVLGTEDAKGMTRVGCEEQHRTHSGGWAHQPPNYVCKDTVTQRMDSLIWRHGNEPGDYGTIFASYVTPLCPFSSVALALYVNHLGATGATTFFNGRFHKGNELVLNLS